MYYKCKICSKKESTELSREKSRVKQKNFYNTPHGKQMIKDANKRANKKFPEKASARAKLNDAVKKGKLVKPKTCSVCFASGRIEGHHEDYGKPLDVIWLCTPCHRKADRVLKGVL